MDAEPMTWYGWVISIVGALMVVAAGACTRILGALTKKLGEMEVRVQSIPDEFKSNMSQQGELVGAKIHNLSTLVDERFKSIDARLDHIVRLDGRLAEVERWRAAVDERNRGVDSWKSAVEDRVRLIELQTAGRDRRRKELPE